MFKPGDIVVCLRDCGGSFTKDKYYTISTEEPDYGRVRVVSDDYGRPNGWAAKYFKLVEERSNLPDWF